MSTGATASADAEPMAGQLHIGAASTSIVPDGSVLVAGQLYMRVSEGVGTPLLASAIAVETRDGDTSLDQAIMISCDLVMIGDEVVAPTRALLAQRLPEVDPDKLVVNATHTHTAPQAYDGPYGAANAEITPAEYREGAEQERHQVVPLAHRVWTADLPVRMVTEEERVAALAAATALEQDPKGGVRAAWQRRVVDRFEAQHAHPTYPTEVHVLRLGDVAIATNQFELFEETLAAINDLWPS